MMVLKDSNSNMHNIAAYILLNQCIWLFIVSLPLAEYLLRAILRSENFAIAYHFEIVPKIATEIKNCTVQF